MLSFLNNEYKEIIKQAVLPQPQPKELPKIQRKISAIANLYLAKFYNLEGSSF